MEVKATAKTLRIQPRKARLVLDLIRGKDVEEAKAICKFTPNKGGYLVGKVLNSAIANAVNFFMPKISLLFSCFFVSLRLLSYLAHVKSIISSMLNVRKMLNRPGRRILREFNTSHSIIPLPCSPVFLSFVPQYKGADRDGSFVKLKFFTRIYSVFPLTY